MYHMLACLQLLHRANEFLPLEQVTAQPSRQHRVRRNTAVATASATTPLRSPLANSGSSATDADLHTVQTGAEHALGWHVVGGSGSGMSKTWWQQCPPGSGTYTLADSLLQSTWVRSDKYEFVRLLSVRECVYVASHSYGPCVYSAC
eukprot:COSAG05_NODE_754_length_7519_cov_4.955256_5_plen_147_part_00